MTDKFSLPHEISPIRHLAQSRVGSKNVQSTGKQDYSRIFHLEFAASLKIRNSRAQNWLNRTIFYLKCVCFLFQYWLDLEKPINRQVGLSLVDPMFRFCVKFYTPDPAQLEEEFTRFLFCLQIKRDLANGILQCNDNTAALMASYIVQGKFLSAFHLRPLNIVLQQSQS